MKKTFFDFCLS